MTDGSRTKADFRALREELGFSQTDFARMLDVKTLTVKRWEKEGPDGFMIPDEAWDVIDERAELHHQMVDHMVERYVSAFEACGDYPKVVTITYYRSQEDYDALGRDRGPFGFANAVALDTARELRRLGFEVRFEYPDSDGNLYRKAAARGKE